MNKPIKYVVQILKGFDNGKRYLLDRDVIIIGRGSKCDIILSDVAISRQHVQISLHPDGKDAFTVVDLKSRNGVFVNDKRLTQAVISSGARLQIGDTVFTITTSTPDEGSDTTPVDGIMEKSDTDSEENLLASVDVKNIRDFPLGARQASPELMEKRLKTLYSFGEIITLPSTLDEKLDDLLNLILQVLSTETACILVKNPVTGNLEPSSFYHYKGETGPDAIKVSWTIIDRCIEDKAGILATDAQHDPRFGDAESVYFEQFRSVLSVPLFFQDTLWGVIFLTSTQQQGVFTDEDLEFIADLANNAAMMIEHHHLMRSHISREKMAETGELVASISHYIKNILFAFTASREMVDRYLIDDDVEMIKSIWPLMKRSTDKISDLVRDMLYFSKEQKSRRQLIDINQIINEVITFYSPVATEKRVKLHASLDESIPNCEFDPTSFHRIVLNLVKNAFDAVKEVSEAEIHARTRASSDGSTILFTLEDNGSGIAPNNVERIFHYLFSTKGYEGTGLGLFITKQIIEDHGGTISVSSELNKGTTFSITLQSLAVDRRDTSENGS